MYHQYFEQELLDLQQEIFNHPPLCKILQEQPNKDIYIMIAEIACYCKVILHGTYTKDDYLKICRDLTRDLVKMRTIYVDSEKPLDITVVQNLDGLEH